MHGTVSHIYSGARRFSRVSAIATIAVVAILQFVVSGINLTTQVVIALLALLVGVPHGAIDHLISLPSQPRSRFYLFIGTYILIAVVAGWAIALWNVAGFQAVVIMSGLHFGFGDASFLNEREDFRGKPRKPAFISGLYAIPAGFLPVALPLTDDRTQSALQRINPAIVNWSGEQSHAMRSSLFVIAWIVITLMILLRHYGMAFDLILLTILGTYLPPLIAFASYFGFWHAVRHTARLVPKLPASLARAQSGDVQGALAKAIVPGLYAVAGTLLVSSIVMVFFPQEFSSSLLWSTLVIVWALTVPHMMSTARFDLRALSK